MVKRIFVLLLALGIALASFGCEKNGQTANTAPLTTESRSTETAENTEMSYDVTVAWVNYASDAGRLYMSSLNKEKMAISSVMHLPIFKCESVEELERFRSDYADLLDFSAEYDEVEAFDKVSVKFDSAFFEENTLLPIYLTAGSGSYRYGVDSVQLGAGGLSVHIRQTNEVEFGTCDMAGWLICVSLPNSLTESCTSFDADLLM